MMSTIFRLEVDLEELYYYRIDRPEGYAIQKVYTRDKRLDFTLTVRSGEMVRIPEGYHPVVAAHGYNVYYLNALAGSARSMAASDDPDFEWVRAIGASRSATADGNDGHGSGACIAARLKEEYEGGLMRNRRLTMAQALIGFLKNQYVERDGKETPFFAGAWGIFGHGNVAGLGQALQENPDFRYYLSRNEQASVHIATAFAKARNRLATFACVSSIGPGATNMITGAAVATINRIPVLLLPGDIFARRNVAPVLQQLESEYTQDVSVNDAFKPVSRYWDRIYRPDQLICSLPEAMRVLTSPAQTGAVTLCLPQDVQAEAAEYPAEMFEKRVWHIARTQADSQLLSKAASWIKEARRPLIIAGGGVLVQRSNRGAVQVRDADRHSGWRDAGGKEFAALRPSAEPRRHRRDRNSGREYRSAQCRSGDRRRYAAERLHDCFEDRISKSRRSLYQHQCRGDRCVQACRHSVWSQTDESR